MFQALRGMCPRWTQVNLRDMYFEGLMPPCLHAQCSGRTTFAPDVIRVIVPLQWSFVIQSPPALTEGETCHPQSVNAAFPTRLLSSSNQEFHCVSLVSAALQTSYRNVLTFFSLTSDFSVRPFPHLIGMSHILHWARHQKALIKTMLLQCEFSGLVNFLSFMYPTGWNSYTSQLVSAHAGLAVDSLYAAAVIFLLLSQKERIFPLNPYIMKIFVLFFFSEDILIFPNSWRTYRRKHWKCILVGSPRISVLHPIEIQFPALCLKLLAKSSTAAILCGIKVMTLLISLILELLNQESRFLGILLLLFFNILFPDLLNKQSLFERTPSETWMWIFFFLLPTPKDLPAFMFKSLTFLRTLGPRTSLVPLSGKKEVLSGNIRYFCSKEPSPI